MQFIDKLTEAFANTARALFEKDGYAAAIVFGVKSTEPAPIGAVILEPGMAKEDFAAAARDMVRRTGAEFAVQVGEIYLAKVVASDAAAVTRVMTQGVKNTPGHVEAVLVKVQSKDGDARCLVAEIERETPGDEDSKGTLLAWEAPPEGAEIGPIGNLWGKP